MFICCRSCYLLIVNHSLENTIQSSHTFSLLFSHRRNKPNRRNNKYPTSQIKINNGKIIHSPFYSQKYKSDKCCFLFLIMFKSSLLIRYCSEMTSILLLHIIVVILICKMLFVLIIVVINIGRQAIVLVSKGHSQHFNCYKDAAEKFYP